ncbi:MAG: hypothetical protein RR472_03730 [Anaerovoracaceae bacterium]
MRKKQNRRYSELQEAAQKEVLASCKKLHKKILELNESEKRTEKGSDGLL